MIWNTTKKMCNSKEYKIRRRFSGLKIQDGEVIALKYNASTELQALEKKTYGYMTEEFTGMDSEVTIEAFAEQMEMVNLGTIAYLVRRECMRNENNQRNELINIPRSNMPILSKIVVYFSQLRDISGYPDVKKKKFGEK